jgi:hypothetical protein
LRSHRSSFLYCIFVHLSLLVKKDILSMTSQDEAITISIIHPAAFLLTPIFGTFTTPLPPPQHFLSTSTTTTTGPHHLRVRHRGIVFFLAAQGHRNVTIRFLLRDVHFTSARQTHQFKKTLCGIFSAQEHRRDKSSVSNKHRWRKRHSKSPNGCTYLDWTEATTLENARVGASSSTDDIEEEVDEEDDEEDVDILFNCLIMFCMWDIFGPSN